MTTSPPSTPQRSGEALEGAVDEDVNVKAYVTGAPETIFLNIFTDEFGEVPFPADHEGITWAEDNVGDADVAYVRADLLTAARQRIEGLEAELRNFAAEVDGCFEAAYIEGLSDQLSLHEEGDPGSLRGLFQRRLLPAHEAAIAILSKERS